MKFASSSTCTPPKRKTSWEWGIHGFHPKYEDFPKNFASSLKYMPPKREAPGECGVHDRQQKYEYFLRISHFLQSARRPSEKHPGIGAYYPYPSGGGSTPGPLPIGGGFSPHTHIIGGRGGGRNPVAYIHIT